MTVNKYYSLINELLIWYGKAHGGGGGGEESKTLETIPIQQIFDQQNSITHCHLNQNSFLPTHNPQNLNPWY